MNIAFYREAIWRDTARALGRVSGRPRREAIVVGSASLLVGAAAIALWLASGVRLGEIARFVPYELGFVFLPGWLAYRALLASPGGRLRQLVFGWSLGYLLEILAFMATASMGVRDLFVVYPAVVGGPAAVVAWQRSRVRRSTVPSASTGPSAGAIWMGALLSTLLLVYAATVFFTQNPLPRDVSSATYQEDTVFTVSLAAEALHHWPVTVPWVAGEPLHYHVFAFAHMAAISQVSGIDLSVVVMRLYEVPLLLLLAMQVVLAGRRIARGSRHTGLVALIVVLFLGELDGSRTGGRFLFDNNFFYWLLSSHTFLLGLIFFLPTIVVLGDLVTARPATGRARAGPWILLTALLIGCIGAKSYASLILVGGLFVFALWQRWRERRTNRPALLALGLSATLYAASNALVVKWDTPPAFVDPLRVVKEMEGVQDVGRYLGRLWGSTGVQPVLGVPYGTFGLLGIPLLGIGLLIGYRRLALSASETWFLSLFVATLPALFILNQPGLAQLFLVFFGVVPGAILAASGFSAFWGSYGRSSLGVAALAFVVALAWTAAMGRLLDASARVEFQLTLLWLLVVTGVAGLFAAKSRRRVLPVAVGVGAGGLALANTPVVWFARLGWNVVTGQSTYADHTPRHPLWLAVAATVVAFSALSIVAVYVARRPSVGQGIATASVGACLVLGLLDTPLDWFPTVASRAIHDKPVYDQKLSGLTAGLYRGLLWIRNNTDPNDVLVVNNHSLHPDASDSKYFYYSAFAQRRVVLESWDYTPQAAARGKFSIDAAHTPFPRRLRLSDDAFRRADASAIRTLVRDYGADYLVVDKVHGRTSAALTRQWRPMFSNKDIDVFAIGALREPPATAR